MLFRSVLYQHRIQHGSSIDLIKLETYRSASKIWRDDVCEKLLNRVSTSSAKFQDNLFEENAIPPHVLAKLGTVNVAGGGIVECVHLQCIRGEAPST